MSIRAANLTLWFFSSQTCIFWVSKADKIVRCLETFLGSPVGMARVAALHPWGLVGVQSPNMSVLCCFPGCIWANFSALLLLWSTTGDVARGWGWQCPAFPGQESFRRVVREERHRWLLHYFAPLPTPQLRDCHDPGDRALGLLF